MVDIREDCSRIEKLWRTGQEEYAPLSVGAALTFHQTCRDKKDFLSPFDYDAALDIAAAALSCLIPIYAINGQVKVAPVPMDVTNRKFRKGATRFQCDDGAIIEPLAIVRHDLMPALFSIARAGVEYTPWLLDANSLRNHR